VTPTTPGSRTKAIALTAVALACFAGNSLLCRPALAGGSVDAATFTAVRLVSGAAALGLLARSRPRDVRTARAKWTSAAALFAYAAPFSYAYLQLGAAIGALILFASVQVTMIGWGIRRGERPTALAWLGVVIALGGLVVLTVPGKSAPAPLATVSMVLAGAAWGAYSLLGRGATGDPVAMTASSFTRAVPMAAVLYAAVLSFFHAHASPLGIGLAAASGALASGAGYSVWYAALRHLTTTRAAALQLLVPVLSAAGAVAFLGESVTSRLAGASAAILGGVAITIGASARRR
jgi:drug/metabolite transporter (DMT)-like permease